MNIAEIILTVVVVALGVVYYLSRHDHITFKAEVIKDRDLLKADLKAAEVKLAELVGKVSSTSVATVTSSVNPPTTTSNS